MPKNTSENENSYTHIFRVHYDISYICNIFKKKPYEKSNPLYAISSFAERLDPRGRILEGDNYYVWCCAPIIDENGKIIFVRVYEKTESPDSEEIIRFLKK